MSSASIVKSPAIGRKFQTAGQMRGQQSALGPAESRSLEYLHFSAGVTAK